MLALRRLRSTGRSHDQASSSLERGNVFACMWLCMSAVLMLLDRSRLKQQRIATSEVSVTPSLRIDEKLSCVPMP
jgi:hypothetical protein